jgi:hypothetical protein
MNPELFEETLHLKAELGTLNMTRSPFKDTLSSIDHAMRSLSVGAWEDGDVKPGQRAERMAWLSMLTTRTITTSKQLTRGESFLIYRWLYGFHIVDLDIEEMVPEEVEDLRHAEVRLWLAHKIVGIAKEVLARPHRDSAVKRVATIKGKIVFAAQRELF